MFFSVPVPQVSGIYHINIFFYNYETIGFIIFRSIKLSHMVKYSSKKVENKWFYK